MKFIEYEDLTGSALSRMKNRFDSEAALGFLQHALLCPAIAACVPGAPLWPMTAAFIFALAALTAADYFFSGRMALLTRSAIRVAAVLIIYFGVRYFVSGPQWLLAILLLCTVAAVTAAEYIFAKRMTGSLRASIKTLSALIIYFAIASAFSGPASSVCAVLLGALGSAAIYAVNRRCDAVKNESAASHALSRIAAAAVAAVAVFCATIRL